MLGMADILNRIFAGMYRQSDAKDGVLRARRQEFLKLYSDPGLFENEYYVLAVMVREYPDLALSREFLQNFLVANRFSIEGSSSIQLAGYASGDTEAFLGFVQSCVAVHDALQSVQFTSEEYMEALVIYLNHYKNTKSIQVLEGGLSIMGGQTIKVRGKQLAGYDGMRTYMKTAFSMLDTLTEKKERKGIITYGINDVDDAETERDAVKLISPYGIKSLDDQVGGIFEGEMVSVVAPAKSGKSRFAVYVLHNAVVHGVNVLAWSIENGYKGWEALLRARHFDYFMSKTGGSFMPDSQGLSWVDDDMIRKGSLSPELRERELASWADLRSNSTYGKITSLDADFDADTFIEVLDQAVTQNNVKLICIDYLQLVQGSGSQSKHERVSEVYQKTLQYLKAKRIAGIFPGQLKQSAVTSMSKMSAAEMVNMELRDAAGESSEVIRTPDVNLALYASVEELKHGSMHIISIPSRNHKTFDPIDLNCDLGSCTFYDVADSVGSS